MKIRLIGSVVWQFASCCLICFEGNSGVWYLFLWLSMLVSTSFFWLTSIFMSLCESKKVENFIVCNTCLKATAEWSVTCVHLKGITRAPFLSPTSLHQSNAIFLECWFLALVRTWKCIVWKTIVSYFWSSLVGRCKLLISRSVDVANIVNLMSVFWANHLSSLFVSSTRSHPNKQAPKEQLVAFSKNGILFQQNSEIRRCHGVATLHQLVSFSHPEETHSGLNFRRFIMGWVNLPPLKYTSTPHPALL